MSLLLGVIQRSNEMIVDDKQPIFGRQSVSLLNFFVAEDIVHFLPNFVATWNPPFSWPFCGPLGVIHRPVEAPLEYSRVPNHHLLIRHLVYDISFPNYVVLALLKGKDCDKMFRIKNIH